MNRTERMFHSVGTSVALACATVRLTAQEPLFTAISDSAISDDYAFSVAWGDYNRDGFIDLLAVDTWYAGRGGSRIYLLENQQDGSFTRTILNAAVYQHAGYLNGATWGDYDNDGFMDLVVANNDWGTNPLGSDQLPVLYRNEGNENRWLKLVLSGTTSNRDAGHPWGGVSPIIEVFGGSGSRAGLATSTSSEGGMTNPGMGGFGFAAAGPPGGGGAAPGGASRGRASGGGFGGPGGGAGAAYASIIAIDFEGQRQYVQLTARALIGVAAADGKFLWRYDPACQPDGHQLFDADLP